MKTVIYITEKHTNDSKLILFNILFFLYIITSGDGYNLEFGWKPPLVVLWLFIDKLVEMFFLATILSVQVPTKYSQNTLVSRYAALKVSNAGCFNRSKANISTMYVTATTVNSYRWCRVHTITWYFPFLRSPHIP